MKLGLCECGTPNRAIVAVNNTPLEPIYMTAAEARVIEQYFLGYSNAKDVAEELGLSIETVRQHVSSVLRKANVDSMLALVARTYKNGGVLY